MGKKRPVLFRGRHFQDEIILVCVRWYLRYSLSYRDVEEMMIERGLCVDHSTIARWVLRAGGPICIESVSSCRFGGQHNRVHALAKSRFDGSQTVPSAGIVASLWFRSVEGALNTIDGYEAMNMVRKGQVRWLAKDDIVGQVKFIESLFGNAGRLLLRNSTTHSSPTSRFATQP